LVSAEERAKHIRPQLPIPQLFLSSATHEGLLALVRKLRDALEAHRGPIKSPTPWRP
jgi:hypothetical protein